ncbi:hypothetical protein RCL1_000798 [Eukaryota sp. TZLM3-RCL]
MKTLVCLGDSLTWGFTLRGRDDFETPYPNFLNIPGFQILRRAQNGAKVSVFSSLIDDECRNASVFVILGGTNNIGLYKKTVSSTLTQMKNLLLFIRNNTNASKFIILEVPPGQFFDDYNVVVEQLNSAYRGFASCQDDVEFVTWFKEIGANFVSDNVHFDGETYRKLGCYLSEVLVPFLPTD